LLQAGTKTGLKIKYRNPLEVGADRIANAIAGVELFPNRNLIIVDFGTATTFCAISRTKEYLGGVIIAGIRISMEALESRTAKLPSVEITPTATTLGKSTTESIQSGLYYGQMGMVKEICARLTQECFLSEDPAERPLIIATGGFAGLFEKDQLFDSIVPDLVLRGLYLAQRMND
jgi:type III pantothenate kinase